MPLSVCLRQGLGWDVMVNFNLKKIRTAPGILSGSIGGARKIRLNYGPVTDNRGVVFGSVEWDVFLFKVGRKFYMVC